MTLKSKIATGCDRVVSTLLDKVLEVSQIDPVGIFPEHIFTRDLQLSANQVRQIISETALALGVHLNSEALNIDKLTLRDAVDHLKQLTGTLKAAA